MASLRIDNRRPCYVEGKKAMFHCWRNVSQIVSPSAFVGGHSGGIVSDTYGIVEYEDGTIAGYIEPVKIRFADGGDFDETAFLPQK